MPTYAAQLGHQPHISTAELAAAVKGFSLHKKNFSNAIIFDSDEELDQEFFNTIGGTVVLAEQIAENTVDIEDIPKVLLNEVSSMRGKLTFGYRTFNVPKGVLRDLYRKSKNKLKDAGRNCRYIGNDKKPTVPVALHDNGIISGKKGCELFVMMDEDFLWIGKTIAAQDINAYTKRDMEKPVRDTTVGLLPPKLAQMMLNFGLYLIRQDLEPVKNPPKRKKKEIYTVYDPFCGTGVIPLECLTRGWHVIASDLSLKAVNGCKKNIDWIRKEEKILKKDVTSDVFKHDATKQFDLKEAPDAIVTETTLGPTFTKRPPLKEAGKLKTENEKIQASFLKNAVESFPNTPIVCMWPAWRQKGGWLRLEKVWKVIEDLGYTPVLPEGIELKEGEKPSLLYSRSDQFVAREIVLLKPKKTSEDS